MKNLGLKFEDNPVPENAIDDKDILTDIIEYPDDEAERNWARNRLIALRRIFTIKLQDFLDNYISFVFKDFFSWYVASSNLGELSAWGIEDEPILGKLSSQLFEVLLESYSQDLEHYQQTQFLAVLEQKAGKR